MPYNLEREISLKAKREDVWETYRDKLTDLVPSMPSVEKIEVIDREVCDDGIRIKNLWHLAIKFPKPIQKLLPSNFMSYYDLAFWNKQNWVCEFYKCLKSPTQFPNVPNNWSSKSFLSVRITTVGFFICG